MQELSYVMYKKVSPI